MDAQRGPLARACDLCIHEPALHPRVDVVGGVHPRVGGEGVGFRKGGGEPRPHVVGSKTPPACSPRT